jgi:mono/diheme cytochrome c family protein
VRRRDPSRRALVGAGLALALALQACGESDEQRAPATPAAPAAEPAPPPAADTGTAAAGDAAAGAASYALFCATCHGASGDAQTPIAQALDPTPAQHNKGEYMNPLTDEHLFRVIKEGGPAVGKAPTMPPWGGTLSDDQIRDVIAFVRTLAVPPYEPPIP